MTKTKWYSRPIVIASEAWQSRRMVRLKAWKSVSILVALALVLSLAITAVPMAGTVEGNPGTIQVDVNDAGCVTGTGQPDPYACVYCNIQDAIDDAFAGDAINVAAGTYNEVVKIGKPLTLLGAQAGVDPRPSVGGRTGDEATIDGGGNSCVTISADNIIITDSPC